MATISKHKILWWLILLLCGFPLIQHLTGLIKSKSLQGDIVLAQKPTYTVSNWLNGVYQDSALHFFNDHIGFYPDFIRINNQLQYWLTNQAKAKGVIVGKENYLFEENYISAYLGSDFLGDKEINKRVQGLSKIQAELQSQGILFLVVLAPGKASYFPEKIPHTYGAPKNQNANYHGFKKALTKQGVHTFDAWKWFDNMKDTSQYPLFPKCGIHWSTYGEYLVMDSLAKTMRLWFPDNIPSLKLESVEWDAYNRGTDYDIGNGMNLIFQLPVYPMAYPKYAVIKPKNQLKKATIIADSYYWGMHTAKFTKHFFANDEFWFYNREIFDNRGKRLQVIDDSFNTKQAVNNSDVVILLCTDANLFRFPFQFTANYFSKNDSIFDMLIQKNIRAIKSDKKWLEKIKQKAKSKKISLDEAIYNDARYMAEKQKIKVLNK